MKVGSPRRHVQYQTAERIRRASSTCGDIVPVLKQIRNPLLRPDSIAVSLGANTITVVAARGLGLVRGLILAWLLSREEFGLMGVAMLVANVLLPACTLGLYEGIARYTPQYESAGSLRRFAPQALVLTMTVVAGAVALLLLVAEPASRVLFAAGRAAQQLSEASSSATADTRLMLLVLVCVLTLAPHHSILALLRGLRMFRALSLMELLAAVAFTALAVVLPMAGYARAEAVIVAYAAANLVSTAAFAPGVLRYCLREGGEETVSRQMPSLRSQLLRFSVWAGGTAVLWHALAYYPMWHLLKVTDQGTVGTYNAVRMVTQVIQIGSVMLVSIVAANANRLWEHEGREAAAGQLSTLTKMSLLVILATAAALSAASSLLIKVLPSSFAQGLPLFSPLLLFFAIVGFVLLFTVRLNLLEKPRLVFFAWLLGAGANVAACRLLLGWPGGPSTSSSGYPLVAAAWAGVIGITVSAVTVVLLLQWLGFALSRNTLLLGLSLLSIGFGWIASVPVFLVVALLAWRTHLVFSDDEYQRLSAVVRSGLVR